MLADAPITASTEAVEGEVPEGAPATELPAPVVEEEPWAALDPPPTTPTNDSVPVDTPAAPAQPVSVPTPLPVVSEADRAQLEPHRKVGMLDAVENLQDLPRPAIVAEVLYREGYDIREAVREVAVWLTNLSAALEARFRAAA